jgi:flagellar biosynthesis/type III secretory pathway M-ring protein FliF/YscJ
MNQVDFGANNNFLLQVINAAIVLIVIWIIVEGLIKFFTREKTSLKQAEAMSE